MKAFLASAACVVGLAFAAPAHASFVVNGDFEGGENANGTPLGWSVAPGTEIKVITGAEYIPCCAVTGSAAALANSFASFGSGQQPNISLLSQVFNTVAGGAYALSFDYGVLGAGSQTLTAQVFNGATLIASNTYTRSANNNLDATFGSFVLNFNSGGGATQIAFNVNAVTNNVDGILDNVGVSGPIPEPATWAMMIGGFGLVGAAMRRRARVSVGYA